MNRRATFMLAIGGAIGIATQSRRARAEFRTSEKDGTMSEARRDNTAGLDSQKYAVGSQFQNLKMVGPQGQVMTAYHRGDTFEVTTADGQSTVFREANLLFKIDTSDQGPLAGRPVILPSGMMGDRAAIFFASPAEISTLVKYRS